MTTEDLKQRFKELLTVHPPLDDIQKLFNQTLDTGALDFEKDEETSYRAATIIFHAILCAMADKWQPISRVNKKASANLQKFL